MNLVLMIVMGIPMTTMTQYQVVRSNPLETLTNYLTTEKINGCEGDIVNLTCHSGNKVRQFGHHNHESIITIIDFRYLFNQFSTEVTEEIIHRVSIIFTLTRQNQTPLDNVMFKQPSVFSKIIVKGRIIAQYLFPPQSLVPNLPGVLVNLKPGKNIF